MKNLKYILILAIACLAFIVIDDVYAISNTSRQSLHLVGTTSYTVYRDGTVINGPSQFNLESIAGTSFSRGSFTDGSYGFATSTFLQWTVPVDIVKGYDKVSFTVGSKWAYFNNATFTTGKGWLACTALSLPPTTTSFEGGFTSFVCDVDQSSVPETGEVTLYLSTYLTKLRHVDQDGGVSSQPISYSFYYQNDVVFYSSEATSIENQIVESNKELNESIKDTNDILNDDTPPESDISALGNVQGLLPPGPVDSLLNIPFEFLSVLTTSFGGVCVPLSGTFVFDSTLTLPCFSDVFYDNVPSFLMNFINLIPSGFILIQYFKHLYKKVDRAMNMNANADDEWGVL